VTDTTTTNGNLYAQAAEIANRIERASIVAHWASPADAGYHAERARTAFREMAALLGYTVCKAETGEEVE
jgi:hypothetical protein